MNYIYTAYRTIDNVAQSIVVKLYGGTGAKFSVLRNYASLISVLDHASQHGSGLKSESYITQDTELQRADIASINVKVVVTNTEKRVVNDDLPRSCSFEVDDTTYAKLTDDIAAKYLAITGSALSSDSKNYVTSVIINLYT